jgi:hypothetical protein
LQILAVTKLDLREISYLVANAAEFSKLRLSSLPSQASDDSPTNAINLFAQMNTLFDYADLRKNPAAGSDGLIDVFAAVGTTFSEAPGSQASNTNPLTPWAKLASLTRRNVADVRTIGEYFGLIQDVAGGAKAIGDFGNNKGIRRIWQALQLIQIMGIPVTALTACTAIVAPSPAASAPPPDQIATNFKNAVKARFTIDQWLPVAQSVFDPLRQKKRDALVAYLVNGLGLENSNQLFEYFLVDPGMEPVVQTSRLRLALSSLQTFVQRCLLNLENGHTDTSRDTTAVNVAPGAIDADWWSWMKRYRVWQANREIFLWPENWMVPELRTDATDLFQNLEGELLQGDIDGDLADTAFLHYLNGLDQRARLDVVASYLDQNPNDAGISTLHVLGRTYSHPPKYFYRTYASQTWSAWEAVGVKIEGDHIALAVWKGRLNLFWVTFISQPQPAQPVDTTDQNIVVNQTNLVKSTVGQLSNAILVNQVTQQQYQPQLHWVDYFQGKWSTPIASDTKKYLPIAVKPGFDVNQVYIRITKDGDETVGEGAMKVHLDFPYDYIDDPLYNYYDRQWQDENDQPNGVPEPLPNYCFRITSKNCDLVLYREFDKYNINYNNPEFYDTAPENVYNATSINATVLTGTGSLTSTFQNSFDASGKASDTTEQILKTVNSFAIVPCANPVTPSPFLSPREPQYAEAGSLVSPFFYKDCSDPSTTDELTFYVQPWLTETTITNWGGWAVPSSIQNPAAAGGRIFENLPIAPQVPVAGPKSIAVADPIHSLYAMSPARDWLAGSNVAVSYNGAIIGKTGGIGKPRMAVGAAAAASIAVGQRQRLATTRATALVAGPQVGSRTP